MASISRNAAQLTELHLRALLGKVIPVSLDAFLALRDTESTFSLLIVGDDPASANLESTVHSFIQHYTPSRILTCISIKDDPRVPGALAAAIIPQLRTYLHGREVQRHRGTIPYESLFSFLGVRR